MILRDLGTPCGYGLTPKKLKEIKAEYRLTSTSSSYQIVKRAMDICGACMGLLLLGLLFPWIALWIYCEDRGPIFYWHWRVGQHGRPFRMYKFRSMIVHAEDYLKQDPNLEKSWQRRGKLVRDPRVTRVGAFLRRTSLDELPQMLNILRGEMSLVGPRAIQFSEMAAYGQMAQVRLLVPPGLTGLCQISGRADISYSQRAQLDYTYIAQRSLSTDFSILCRTLPAVMRGRGAY